MLSCVNTSVHAHVDRHGKEGSRDCVHKCRLHVRALLFQTVWSKWMGLGQHSFSNLLPSFFPHNNMIAGSGMRFGEKCLYGPRIKLASMTMRCTISIQAICGIITITLVQSGPIGTTAFREEGIGFITRVVMTLGVLESNKTTLKSFCNLDF